MSKSRTTITLYFLSLKAPHLGLMRAVGYILMRIYLFEKKGEHDTPLTHSTSSLRPVLQSTRHDHTVSMRIVCTIYHDICTAYHEIPEHHTSRILNSWTWLSILVGRYKLVNYTGRSTYWWKSGLKNQGLPDRFQAILFDSQLRESQGVFWGCAICPQDTPDCVHV